MFKAYDLVLLKLRSEKKKCFCVFFIAEKKIRYVAVKLHQMEPFWPEKKKESYMKHALRELSIQKSVRHPRVVGVTDS